MKKVKIVLWVIIAAFVALLFFKNQEFFLEKRGITYFFGDAYKSPDLPLVVWFLITLIIGLLVSYIFGLSERFKLKKTIKGLKTKIDEQMEMISQIRSELESRAGISSEEIPPVPNNDTAAVSEASEAQISSDD